MAVAKRKPAVNPLTDTTTSPGFGPQFTVVGKDPQPSTINHQPASDPFGADPFAVLTKPKKAGGKTYPVAVLTEQQRAVIDELLTQKADYKALEGSIKKLEELIKPDVVSQFIDLHTGCTTVASSMTLEGIKSTAMLVICGDSGGRYTEIPIDRAGDLAAAIGGMDVFKENFADGTTLKVKYAEVPDAVKPEFSRRLMELAAELGVTNCIEAKRIILPKPEFKVARWSRFDAATNKAVNAVIPLIPSLKEAK